MSERKAYCDVTYRHTRTGLDIGVIVFNTRVNVKFSMKA